MGTQSKTVYGETVEDIIREEVGKLKNREDVRAVAIVGSYAREPSQSHNDIDLFIIVEGDWRKRKTEVVDGLVVEKFFNSLSWAEHYIENLGENWYGYHWMSNADVRYDPEEIFDDLERKAEEMKEEKLSEDVNEEELLYNIWDMKQDLETDDIGQKRYVMYQLFDYLVRKQYLLKGEVPVKKNYRVKHLKDFDGYMYKLAQEFLTSSSTLEKERKLEDMIKHVTRGIGEPKPEWETEKEEFENI